MSSVIQENLADEVQQATAAVLDRFLAKLRERTFSPRIKLLSIEQVQEATGLGQTTVYKLIGEGKFPRPQMNLGKNLWRESVLISWAERNDPNKGDA